MNSIRFFISNKKFTLVLSLFFVFYGLSGLIQLKKEQFPSVNIGSANITTSYPGASAEDIEAKITNPIEDEIRTVSGIKEVKSISQPGLSIITVYVDIDNYKVADVISKMQRAIDRVPDLPLDLPAPPNFLEIKSDEFPILELAVVGSNDNRLRNRVADELKDELEDNKNVAGVQMKGYYDRQFNIYLKQEELKKFHVGVNEVVQRLKNQNITVPAGSLVTPDQQTLIKIEGKLNSAKEIEDMVVRSNFSGERILLRDIARIEDGEEIPDLLASYNGEEATLLVITKKEGADIVDLTKETTQIVKLFEQKYKEQLKFPMYFNEGLKVQRRLDILQSNGISGLILVLILLFLFLPGRIGFVTALSLPLAVFATLGLMLTSGLTLNTITILALVISLGMLVDNAVVISENYVRLRREGYGKKGASVKTIKDLWIPIAATALTTIAAFLPMLVTKGIIGQFIIGIPIVVSASLIISLLEGYFLLPMRLTAVDSTKSKKNSANRNQKTSHETLDWFDRLLLPKFERLSRILVRRRYSVAIAFTVLLVGSLLLMGIGNKFVLFPADQTEIYTSRIKLPRGTRVNVTIEKMSQLKNLIQEKLGTDAEHITYVAGDSRIDLGDPKAQRGENVGLLRIFVSQNARNNRSTNEVLNVLRSIKLEGAEELSFEALINGPPVGDPITAVFRSNNEKDLKQVTDSILEKLKSMPGILNLKLDDVIAEDEIKVEVDIPTASRLGLDIDSIGAAIRTGMAGIDVADINLENKEVDYHIKLLESDRRSMDSLKQLLIMNPSGNLIPLEKVAKFVNQTGQANIKRFNYKRAKTLTGSLDDKLLTALDANQIVEKSFKEIQDNYPSVSLKFGGEGERIQESMTSLAAALLMSVIGIFAILVFLFNSYLRPFIIMTTIPLGMVGVSVAFFVEQRPISFMAMIGIIGLGGIIVNSGIVLISFIESLKKEIKTNLEDVLVKASTLRLRAVVVTSITTVAGLLPTAYGIGGSDEFIVPLTLAMAWGLTSGTVLTLLWIPSAYAITEDMALFFKNLKIKKWQLNLKQKTSQFQEILK